MDQDFQTPHYYPVRPFQAFPDCPSCGLIALHDMNRPPHGELGFKRGETFKEGEHIATIYNWSGQAVRIASSPRVYRVDATTCDVVRRCECGTEWGEK